MVGFTRIRVGTSVHLHLRNHDLATYAPTNLLSTTSFPDTKMVV